MMDPEHCILLAWLLANNREYNGATHFVVALLMNKCMVQRSQVGTPVRFLHGAEYVQMRSASSLFG
jgi:hypothetical protein